MLALLLSLFVGSIPSLAATSVEIAYRNGPLHFKAEKFKSEYFITDEFGRRKLAIRKCNQKIVEKHWQGLVRKASAVQAKSKAADQSQLLGRAILKFDGVESRVFNFEPAYQFFNRAPARSHILFVESMRLCRKK